MSLSQEIAWGDGSGDKIYITAGASEGNQTVQVSSDPNTGAARTKTITFAASGVSPVTLTVNQEAGTSGGDLSDYVQSGLVLHMDGKSGKTGSTSWASVVGNTTFTNYGATFNNDHIYFDGVDDYLSNTSYTAPASGTGTIEVVIDNETFGEELSLVFMAKTRAAIGFGTTSAKYILYSCGATNRLRALATLAKASFSISYSGRYQNGESMSTNSSDYWGGQDTNTNYIGKRKTGGCFKGKIYSIRIYNRRLTEAEVLANLAVDNIRFNLGLSL